MGLIKRKKTKETRLFKFKKLIFFYLLFFNAVKCSQFINFNKWFFFSIKRYGKITIFAENGSKLAFQEVHLWASLTRCSLFNLENVLQASQEYGRNRILSLLLNRRDLESHMKIWLLALDRGPVIFCRTVIFCHWLHNQISK